MMSETLQRSVEEIEEAYPQTIPSVTVAMIGGHVLPQTADDLTAELGLAVYEAMETEVSIAKSDLILRASVSECGYAIGGAIEEPTDQGRSRAAVQARRDYEESERIRLHLEATLAAMRTPMSGVIWNALEAHGDGHKLFEMVREKREGFVEIAAIKPKPRRNYSLGVTRNMDLVGAVPGNGLLVYDFPKKATKKQRRELVPAEDLFVFTLRGRDGDPRGLAAKRAVYDPWHRKQLAKSPSMLNASQFGGGKVSVEGPKPEKDVSLPKEIKVKGKTYDFVDFLLDQAQRWTSGGLILLPGGWTAKQHVATGGHQVFEAIFDRCDNEMVEGWLTVTRATDEAEHGSKADSQTAVGMFGKLVNYLRQQFCEQFRQQVIVPWVRLNYGLEASRKYAPKLLMQTVEKTDVPALLIAVSRGIESGAITPGQLPFWDRQLGQPERDVAETKGQKPETEEEEDGPDRGPTFRSPHA